MINKTRKGTDKMLEIIGELETLAERCDNGSSTAYVKAQKVRDISGHATGIGFGRGGIPIETRIVQYFSEEKPNITGSATGIGFGRGGVPKETSYIFYKSQEKKG
ncbi:MAG: hypothetical protein Q8Q42_02665 [Nanoarchaeota archaeon]|nr:hypothetical protein [Nanoarchaeota archaeon]